MAYLYNFVNKPAKTQKLVHQILTELYTNQPDGISGNEDCGQMSAWYIFSSLGFYPVTPGSNQYIIGSPLFEKATINLENGKQFIITAKNISQENKYIETVSLNGKTLNKSFILHKDIATGGSLDFSMTNAPSSWATKEGQEPETSIDDYKILLPPFIAEGEVAFKNNSKVTLAVSETDAEIFYALNNDPFIKYTSSFTLNEEATVKTYSIRKNQKSKVLETKFYKIDPNLSLKLNTKFANEYNAGGNDALIDGIRGAKDFRTGAWQGYSDKNVDVVLDLGRLQPINSITTNFLQDQRSWIFYPTQVECWVSEDGEKFISLGKQKIDTTKKDENVSLKTIEFKIPSKTIQYIKLVATNLGAVPEWHLGHPFDGKAWIFIDEIAIK
jgi:hypothetical protein